MTITAHLPAPLLATPSVPFARGVRKPRRFNLLFRFVTLGIFGLVACSIALAQPRQVSHGDTVSEDFAPLRLGVFAYRPKEILQPRFEPLARHLSEALGQPVTLHVLQQGEIEAAVAQGQLDLLMTNPAHYVVVRKQVPAAKLLATIIANERGIHTDRLGGVILTRADRGDLRRLPDLIGRRVAIPGRRYLGGYQVQVLELLEAGVPLESLDFVEAGSHDGVIQMVLAGEVDAGFVRTGLIESWIAEGKLEGSELKLLDERNYPDFPFRTSSRLYPEWPFVVLRSLDVITLRRLSAALFALEPEHLVTRSLGYAGFSPPADYAIVDLLAFRLRMPPYDQRDVAWQDIWRQYRYPIISAAVAGLVLLVLLMILAWQRRQLTYREALFATFFDNASVLAGVLDERGRLCEINHRALAVIANRAKDVLGQPFEHTPWWRAEDQLRLRNAIVQALRGEVATFETSHPTHDGRAIEVIFTAYPVQVRQQRFVCAIGVDVTTLKAQQRQLRLAASVFEHAREGIVITDSAGRIIDANPALAKMLGYAREELIGQSPRLWRSGRHDAAFYREMWRRLRDQGHWSGEVWDRRRNGELFAAWLNLSAVFDEQGKIRHYLALLSDITPLKAKQMELEHLAQRDALTGLPNRWLLFDRLEQALRRAQRENTGIAVVFIDLDGFKAINDTFGHDAGDHLLVVLSRALQQCLRESDTLARLGGDEFVAILEGANDLASVRSVVARLLAAASQPVPWQGHELRLAASIGVAQHRPPREASAQTLLNEADATMYEAKHRGKGRACYLTPGGRVISWQSAADGAEMPACEDEETSTQEPHCNPPLENGS